tara:strand:+ start:600 stop:905 length:306 start_codon:yes stop_codon:yes gene_type:complete
MSNFSINKVKQVDANFFKFLRDSTQFMLDYDNLLIGLKDLNKNHNTRRVVFVNSKCSDKGYVCLNCKDTEFEKILKTVEDTINLHEYRMKESKKILSEFKN